MIFKLLFPFFICISLSQPLAPTVKHNSDIYQLQGYIGDGLYSEAIIGSNNQSILLSLDTTVSSIILNDVNSTEPTLFSYDPYSSESFQNLSMPFNISSIFDSYATGQDASDIMSIFANNQSFDQLRFRLANTNSIGLKTKNVVEQLSEKIVITSSKDLASSKVALNTLGLSLQDTPMSLLNQLVQNNITSTRLFSLYVDDKGPVIDFGAINTAKYDGLLHLTPILETSYVETPTETSYQYPFVTLTGILLMNYDRNVSLNVSENILSIPTLLDTSSTLSYLPYSLLVDLASQFGATYSPEHSLWIQSCSFQNVNGSIGFDFHALRIQVPLKNLVIPLIDTNGNQLYFESGDPACALAFSSSSVQGFSSLGTPFFKAAFTVFDYENKVIGLAQSKDSSSEDEMVNVNNKIDYVVNVTSLVGFEKFSPTAIIMSPTSDVTLKTSVSGQTDYPDHLLTVSPVVTTVKTDTPTPLETQAPTSTTINPNAVAVTSGPFFEAKGSHTVKVCRGLAVLSALCIFLF